MNPDRPPVPPNVQMAKEETGSASVVRATVEEGAEASIALPSGENHSRRGPKPQSESREKRIERTGSSSKKMVLKPSVQHDEEEIESTLVHRKRKVSVQVGRR